jgi:hypothetical protein
MAIRHIPDIRYDEELYCPSFTICDSVELFWERLDLGVYQVGVLIKGAFFFNRVKAVTDDFGDLVMVN